MQRWIAIGVVAAVLLGALGVGAFYARKVYKDNSPHPVWIPIPIPADADMEQMKKVVDALEEKLSEPELLEKVSADLGLPGKLELPDDAACAAELKYRLFVRVGDASPQMGMGSAIHVGMKGKSKDRSLTTAIVDRLGKDVWRILGIKTPEQGR
ncbi:MAG: hypothetical protein ACQCXQ_02950 [Verrucomicrobiales bacterium]|nr:hypothetical protein [Verrucomicrobiota bacterium JB025]